MESWTEENEKNSQISEWNNEQVDLWIAASIDFKWLTERNWQAVHDHGSVHILTDDETALKHTLTDNLLIFKCFDRSTSLTSRAMFAGYPVI